MHQCTDTKTNIDYKMLMLDTEQSERSKFWGECSSGVNVQIPGTVLTNIVNIEKKTFSILLSMANIPKF